MTVAPTQIPDEAPIPEHHNQIRFVVDVLIRHRWMILIVTVAAGALGAFAGWRLVQETPGYDAVATLFVKPSLYESAWLTNIAGPNTSRLTPSLIRSQLSDRTLAEEVARALIQEDISAGRSLGGLNSQDELDAVAARIEKQLILETDDAAGVLYVHAQGPTAHYAERRADLAARVLVEHSRRQLLDEQKQTYAAVEEEIERIRNGLDQSEAAQWNFREEIGFQTHEQAWNELEAKTAERRDTEAQRKELFARLAELERDVARTRRELPNSLGEVSEAAVESLKYDLDELIGRRVELQVIYRPDSGASTPLAYLAEEIRDKKQAILIAVGDLGTDGGAWEQYKALYQKKIELEFQLSDLEIKAATTSSIIQQLETEMPLLADKRFEYQQLVHETEQARAQFGRMIEKQFELKTAQNREMASLERRDAVVVSPLYAGRRDPITSTGLIGAAIGFIAVFAFAMMRESMDTSIRTPEDVTQYIGLDVLGTIPLMKFNRPKTKRRKRGGADEPGDMDACVITRYDPKSPVSEAYRSLRTNFQFATLQQQPRTVMFTSAVPGEGKTTTAVNFAVTMADRGMRVLLVDTDLRRPHIHRVLNMDRGPGLSDAIRKETPLEEVIRPTEVENLSIISSGRVPPNPSELIGSDTMKEIIAQLRSDFDLVVCDAPSLHVVTDPVLLATNMDTVLLVISVSNARRETIQRAKKFLETANPSVAGVVLNGLKATRRHYYYYYYYYDSSRVQPARSAWFQRL